jgi:hypothetical protein
MPARASSAEDAGKTPDPNTADTTQIAAPADTGQVADASVKDANTQAPDPAAASPSAADDKGAKKEPTLADVLKTAANLDADGKSPVPAKDGKPVGEAVKTDDAKAAAEDPKTPKVEDKDLPFHNHPRWKEVITERDTLRERVAKLEPDVEQYGKITAFMSQHNLSPDETSQGFVIMAMIKAGDPRALGMLDEYRNKLAVAIGDVLPADLKSQVDAGALTEEAAREVSRGRVRVARADTKVADAAKRETDRVAADAERAALDVVVRATDDWVALKSKSDPDFAKKEASLERYVKALIHDFGKPKNAADAVKLMDAAYTEVNKTFAGFIPRKEAITPVPNGGSSNSGAKPVPKSVAEAIRLAAAG